MKDIMTELAELNHLEPFLFEYEIMHDLSKWRGYLGHLDYKEFNAILTKVVPSFVRCFAMPVAYCEFQKPDFVFSQQNLTQLRKKVKGWFDNEKKAETRGGGLVRDEELPEFKEILKKIIRELHKKRTRSFEWLRSQVIPVMEEIHKKSKTRKTKNNMFSKRFWHSFLHKEENYDLKLLWEEIPKKNAKKPTMTNLSESVHQDSDSTPDGSPRNSVFQEIPECSNPFIKDQQETILAPESPFPVINEDQMIEFDVESLDLYDSKGVSWTTNTGDELTNHSSPPVHKANNMEEELVFDLELDQINNEIQQRNEIKWLDFLKDNENELEMAQQNVFITPSWNDLDLNNWENLGY